MIGVPLRWRVGVVGSGRLAGAGGAEGIVTIGTHTQYRVHSTEGIADLEICFEGLVLGGEMADYLLMVPQLLLQRLHQRHRALSTRQIGPNSHSIQSPTWHLALHFG